MSNLLDKASILLTPTAYDNGHMNAIKPYENLYGLEQGDDSVISNSGDAIMTKTSSLNYNATSGGTQTSSVRPRLLFNNVTVGKKYRITIKATNRSGNIIFKLYNGSSYIINNNDLSSDINFTFTAQSSTTVNFNFDGREVFNVDLEISLKEDLTGDFDFSRGSAATRVNAQGLVEEITDINLPRIDYTDGCGNWLLEGQSTNLVTYSEDFSQWQTLGISGSTTVTYVSDLVNPDGSIGGYKVSGQGVYLNLSLVAGTEKNIYARTVSGTGTAQLLSHNSNTNNTFNLTEDWQRFDLNYTSNIPLNFYAVDLRGASSTLTELYVWGANATNDQDYPTSYIPTNGATNTRLQDLANNSGNASLINSTEGVLYAEISGLAKDSSYKLISLKTIDYNNRIEIGIGINNKIHVYLVSNSTNLIGSTQQDFTIDELFKVALKWSNTNGCTLYINGSQITTAANSTFSALDFNALNFNNFFGNPFYGKTKALAVYKEALTDANLRSLTYPPAVATTFDLDFDTIANNFTFTRGSEATFVNAQGLIESTASNDAPRIDYSTGAKAFLLEPQSTNLIPYSEDISTWQLVNISTEISNSVLSPDGSSFMTKATFSSHALNSYIRQNRIMNAGSITVSIFVKKGLIDAFTSLRIVNTDNPVNVWFDLDNGTIASESGSPTNKSIVDYGNGIYRISVTTTSTSDLSFSTMIQSASIDGGRPTENATQFYWGGQAENLPYATSYIPTSGASATRNQELCVDATPVINSTEGTLYAEISALANNTTNERISLSYDNQNYVRIAINNSQIVFAVFNNGAYQVNTNYTVSDITDFNKIAVKYKENDFALWINGTEVRTVTSGLTSFSSPLDHINFSNANGGGSFFYGNTKGLKYYPKALADVQLEDLTTI